MTKVFIACTGLGRVNRGFESFAQECFDALQGDPALDLQLFKGGGPGKKKTTTLLNLPRYRWLTRKLGSLTNRTPYTVEQESFFLSFLPYVQFGRPDVILFSDKNLGDRLWRWRNYTKQAYQLMFSNGGPISPNSFNQWDHVHQVTPMQFDLAVKAGVSPAKQSLLPYGIQVDRTFHELKVSELESLRVSLGFAKDREIVLSVAAINESHKRMGYLIREFAKLPEPRPYLLLLGQQDSESSEIISLGMELLGKENFGVRTVSQDEVSSYYKLASIFVLASVSEGFGRVLAEASAHGLPCLVHDYETTRFVLGDLGHYSNLRDEGALAEMLASQLVVEKRFSPERRLRHRSVYEKFSWDHLRLAYSDMIERCAQRGLSNEVRQFV